MSISLISVGDSKKKRRRKLHHIGFAVYEVPNHMARLTPVYVAEHVRLKEMFSEKKTDTCFPLYSQGLHS